MRIGQYSITRFNARNLELHVDVMRQAKSTAEAENHMCDIGDEYETTDFIGYYSKLSHALLKILELGCMDSSDMRELSDAVAFITRCRNQILEEVGDKTI